MSEGIKFIHAADLHLDSPFIGLSDLDEDLFENIKESTFTALNNLIEEAIKHQVDFVLIVGDLFDNSEQSLKAQIKLKAAFEKLNKYDIKVYLSYGNHDFTQGTLYPVEYHNNITIYPAGQPTRFRYHQNNNAVANMFGFSYETRAVNDDKIPECNPPNRHEIPLHTATLHGSADSPHGH